MVVKLTWILNSPEESQKGQFSTVSGWLGSNGEQVFDKPISVVIRDASDVYLDDSEIYFG